MPSDLDPAPPSKSSNRRVLLILLLIIAGGMTAPLVVSSCHQRKLGDNEAAALRAVRAFAAAQADREKSGAGYAQSFTELGGAWAQVRSMDAPDPTDVQGYRYRVLSYNRAGKPGYALLATPVRYGFTGRYSYLLAGPPTEIHAIDWGVKSDTVVPKVTEYSVPPGAFKVE